MVEKKPVGWAHLLFALCLMRRADCSRRGVDGPD